MPLVSNLLSVFFLMMFFLFGATSVFGQSYSDNFEVVDFLTPQASISSSDSFSLEDSIDYYGGIAKSAGFIECTGNFAVLSECAPEAPIIPPPPVDPPPVDPPGGGDGGGGSGSGGPTTGGSGGATLYPGCQLGEPCAEPDYGSDTEPDLEPDEDTIDSPVDVTDDFDDTSDEPVLDLPEPESELVPEIEIALPPARPIIQPIIPSSSIDASADFDEVEDLRGAAADFDDMFVLPWQLQEMSCEEEICHDFRLQKSEISRRQTAAVCKIYMFGAFRFYAPCQTWILIFVSVLAIIAGIVLEFFRRGK